jgi:hypothetical protein
MVVSNKVREIFFVAIVTRFSDESQTTSRSGGRRFLSYRRPCTKFHLMNGPRVLVNSRSYWNHVGRFRGLLNGPWMLVNSLLGCNGSLGSLSGRLPAALFTASASLNFP